MNRKQEIAQYRIFLLIIVILNIAMRVHFAKQVEFPLVPKNNPVHLSVADNLYNGKGFTEDFIYFFTPNASNEISHPSNGIFMPFTSMVIYGAYILFGKSLFSISIISIFASLLISIFIYLFIKELTQSRTTRFSAFLFSLFLPSFFMDSIIPISTVYSTLFILWSLYWIMLGLKKNGLFIVLSALPAAAASLTSLVGLAIFPVLILLGLQYKQLRIWKHITWFFIISAIIISPWFIRNHLAFGSMFTLRLDNMVFLQSFEDLFCYSKDISFTSFMNWGIRNIITFKIKSVLYFISVMINYSSLIVFLLGITGIIITFIEKAIKKELAGYFFYFVAIFVFAGFIFSAAAENEILQNSISSFIPFLIIFASLGIERIITNKMYQKIFVVLAFILLCYSSISDARAYIKKSSLQSIKYERLSACLENYRAEKPVIMTSFPAEMNLITGLKSVMIPNESDSVIFNVAKKYDIKFLHAFSETKNPANLMKLPNLQLIYIDYNSDFRLYRILPDSTDDKNISGK